jgi:hypothetical protein
VLIVVGGSSGLGRVAGISAAHPAALVEAVVSRPARYVILLTPWYAATAAREQAHVTIAADPSIRVCVLPLLHHPLTLTLLAAVTVEAEGLPGGWANPGEAVQLLNQSAARSRSLVWHPRLRGLRDPRPSLGQLASGILSGRGFFAEIGAPAGYVRGRAGFAANPDEFLCAPGELPSTLRNQLGSTAVARVDVTTSPHPAYATKGTVALTGLVRPLSPPRPAPPCPTCSVSLLATGCSFCGTGPRASNAHQPVAPRAGGSRSASEGVRS